MLLYSAAGVIAAVGGVVYTVMTRQGNPAALLGLEMTIISIAVLGGIDIAGGKGSILGLTLGLVFFIVINNSLILIQLLLEDICFGCGDVHVCLGDCLKKQNTKKEGT